ncbi:MAG: hypothetical protein K8R23_17730 [Chthoniobacter sp.]|nr:hypothetical protein [Chthoniobacter sp.]
MKALLLAAVLLQTAVHAAPSAASSGAVVREEGAIYLEDLVPKPVRLATIADTPIHYKIDMERYLGTLKKGQIVELQAVSDHAYRVRGKAAQGQVAGWVDPKFLNALPKDFIANLKQNAARRDEVAALIVKNEVAVNMTPDEVLKSLGKPNKKSSHLDAKGREETWEFVKYELIPREIVGRDIDGNLVKKIIYEKVPKGKLAISFVNDLVATVEQTEGSLEKAARVKIIPAPFIVSF